MIRFTISLLISCLGVPVLLAQSKLPTVDEALERSAMTGRPVFAMAGQKT